MKAKTLSIFNYLLSCILSMFGLQSCREEEMYGCPHADYKVDVCVINDKGEGMPYEKVVIRKCDEKGEAYTYERPDTIYTGSTGIGFHKFDSSFPMEKIRAVTINESGRYENDSVYIDFVKTKEEGSGMSYYVEYSGKVELKLKEIKKDSE